MYQLAQTYIRFDFNASQKFKESLERYLLYKGKMYFEQFYHKEFIKGEVFFQVEFDEGSLKSRLKIIGAMAFGALITYGSFRESTDYLVNDARTISEHISSDVKSEDNIDPRTIGRVERRLGLPGKVNRLYNDIEYMKENASDLSPNQQKEIIERISHEFSNLIIVLDRNDAEILRSDIFSDKTPPQIKTAIDTPTSGRKLLGNFPEDIYYKIPKLDAIKPEEVGRLYTKDEIIPFGYLPPP